MKSLELTKISAAVLVAGIAFAGAGQFGKVITRGERPRESAIHIGNLNPTPATPAAPAAPALEPVSALLASASPEAGQAIFNRNCGICHSVTEGGRNGVGPNLWNVVGGPHAHAEGFNYSAALKAKTGPWSYEELNAWLVKPAAYAPGTRMAFAGLANTQQRAEVIAYLRTLSSSPQPLPSPQAAAAAATPAAAPAAAAGPFADLPPLAPLLASADAENGRLLFTRNCGICHTPTEGGRNGVGPNLWGIVGRHHAAVEGFNYSAANKALAAEEWGYEDLFKWLYKPTAYMPGTRMIFAGVPDHKNRADIIAYLRTLATEPKPLP